MKKNKGESLVEVLVSVVIVGIIGVCIFNIFAFRSRMESKSTLNNKVSTELRNLFNIFTVDPENFIKNYGLEEMYENEYYVKNVSESGKYCFHIFYDNTNKSFCEVKVEIYIDDEIYKVKEQTEFVRKIYLSSGDQNEE